MRGVPRRPPRLAEDLTDHKLAQAWLAHTESPTQEERPMKILLAADGSAFTKRMLGYLAAHDEWLGAHHQYTVLSVALPLPPRAVSALDKATVKGYYDDGLEKVFKPIRTFFGKQKIAAEFVGKVGHPADLIAETAEKGDFDLLIMGSHGHGNLGNLVSGSVATRTMAQCKTPVLLIR
jgi:nucleotide-binding universal stress UspA family protein